MARSTAGESVLTRIDRILGSFDADNPALTVSEVSRRARLPIGTAHRIVNDLVEIGYLERAAGKRVRVGVRLWERGPGDRGPWACARRRCRSWRTCTRWSGTTPSWPCWTCSTRCSSNGFPPGAARPTSSGSPAGCRRMPARAGWCCSRTPPPRVQEELLATPLPRFTRHTVTDPAATASAARRRPPPGLRHRCGPHHRRRHRGGGARPRPPRHGGRGTEHRRALGRGTRPGAGRCIARHGPWYLPGDGPAHHRRRHGAPLDRADHLRPRGPTCDKCERWGRSRPLHPRGREQAWTFPRCRRLLFHSTESVFRHHPAAGHRLCIATATRPPITGDRP